MGDPQRPVLLLSLDGGGVRGLSPILILEQIMKGVNDGRDLDAQLQPWQVFDMMGGTSTGGIIAIMLGRLHMTLEECKKAYIQLSKTIFTAKHPTSKVLRKPYDMWNVNSKFDSTALEAAIKTEIWGKLPRTAKPEDELLNDPDESCKVFVCAARQSNSQIAILRSYKVRDPGVPEILSSECKIWEACRATSAAPSFFDPITIGQANQKFIDGAAAGYNNPVRVVHQEAKHVWPDREFFLISIGTGGAQRKRFAGNLGRVAKAVAKILTDTEIPTDSFFKDHKDMVEKHLFFRFNVAQGLEDVGLEEYKELNTIADATQTYLDTGEIGQKMKMCIEKLRGIPQEDCLRSLAFKRMDDRRENIDGAFPDTCAWLFENENYRKWLNDRHGLLWIKGVPGSGKSTLMKQALQRTRGDQQKKPQRIAVMEFFFNSRGELLEKTSLGFFRSILHQILQQIRPLLPDFLPMFRQKRDTKDKNWEWYKGELSDFFLSAVATSQQKAMVLFVDALDECEQTEVEKVMEFFEDSISRAKVNGSDLKICFSSRHYPTVYTTGRCLDILVEDQNKVDIETYTRRKLLSKSPDGQSSKLVEDIISKASGVFLWVVIVVDLLIKDEGEGRNLSTMRRKLQEVPDKLEDLFRQILDKGDDKERQETAQLMRWVLFAERPLTPTELRFALAFCTNNYTSQREWELSDDFVGDEQMEKQIRSQSRGLVEVKKSNLIRGGGWRSYNKSKTTTSIAQFIHESVREFFQNGNGFQNLEPSPGGKCAGSGHDRITLSCVNYIRIKELREIPIENDEPVNKDPESCKSQLSEFCARYPYLNYAVTFVFIHAKKAESKRIQEKLVEYFHSRDGVFKLWRYLHDLDNKASYRLPAGPQATLLHIASKNNLLTCLTVLLGNGADVNAQGGRWGNALQVASSVGHNEVVQWLLREGADANARGGWHGTALQAASYSGHCQVVQWLLENGADVNAQGGRYDTALQAASYKGHDQVVQRLLRQGADANAQRDYNTALSSASHGGYDQIVQRLLRGGANVNAQGGWHGTALQAASSGNHDRIVQWLLKNGADANVQGGKYGTPLQAASLYGHDLIVRRLLENGADVNAQGGEYGTALQAASYHGHGQVVQRLIESGADVSAKGGRYGTALQAASCDGHDQVIQRLFREGADANALGGMFGTALCAASYFGRDLVVQRLLENGANANAQEGEYGSALQMASYKGRDQIIQRLLENGADVNAQGGVFGTALQVASYGDQDRVVQRLLESGADVNAQGGKFGTALQAALCTDHDRVVQRLLQKGADCNAQGGKFGNALQAAAYHGHKAVVQQLLQNGLDVNYRDPYGRVALHLALRGNRPDMVEYLLSIGADWTLVDMQGCSATHHAASGGSVHALKKLLELSPDLHVYDSNNWSPLHWAARNGDVRAVQLLLDAGADPREKDRQDRTPLDVAVSIGNDSVIAILPVSIYGSTTTITSGETEFTRDKPIYTCDICLHVS